MRPLRNIFTSEPVAPDGGETDVVASPIAERYEVAERYPTPEEEVPLGPLPPLRIPPPRAEEVRLSRASAWSTWRATLPLSPTPRQIAGQHLGRTSLVIRNTSTTVTAAVGPSSGVSVETGFPISAGGTLTLENTGEVWGVTPDGSEAALVILSEFDVHTGGA
ncbi:MAG: hypothetical protein LC798_05245 [Chloroflexi bacterium]|nr:hypothetical protein [Chloroflexota bacterium]